MTGSGRQISIGIGEGRFPAGAHICLIYSDPTERLRVIARFFAAGREAKERLLHGYDSGSDHDARRELERCGFPPGNDLFVVPAIERSKFSAEKAFDYFKAFHEGSIQQGYAGSRGSGEVPWAARDMQTVLQYEARLTEVLAQYPMTAICRYDLSRFNGATIMDVLSVHPYMIVTGQVIRNPFFIAPAQFLERYRETRT
jgi:hypothetical protein